MVGVCFPGEQQMTSLRTQAAFAASATLYELKHLTEGQNTLKMLMACIGGDLVVAGLWCTAPR